MRSSTPSLAARRRRIAAMAVAVVLALAGCQIAPLDPSLDAGILTFDGSDSYGITLSGGTITAAAPSTNSGGNLRVAFWRKADSATTNHQACADFDEPGHALDNQPGIALRITKAGNRTRAITVTKNIWGNVHGTFNMHVMDTEADPAFVSFGQFSRWDAFTAPGGGWAPYPWRMCAKVVGNTVAFLAWPLTHATPAWGDPDYGGSATLPAGWGAAGRPGFYVGHLKPGRSLSYSNLFTYWGPLTLP